MENSTSKLQENIEDSINIAVGDHNFPNLAQLLASTTATDDVANSMPAAMSLAAILSPTSTTVTSSIDSEPAPTGRPVNVDLSHPRPSETAEDSDFSIQAQVLPVVHNAKMEKKDKKHQ